ncbi:hypothetical protein Tsubulata_016324 [Turnera subulata]|uniref:RRM domain-containing protein n=1 Tax=Turnera subulata TaxID=218843 RepID=A0A9Q0JIY7_9ROSI|nr:hypothetical protein Tsubulata_016324 [Turnera subulata]
MALLRLPLPCSPSSTPYFSTEPHQTFHKTTLLSSSLHRPTYPTNHAYWNPSLSWSLAHNTTSLQIVVDKNTSRSVLRVSSTAQDTVLGASSVDAPAQAQPESNDGVETQEEEYSKTRLLASNIPWSCTPEDIRSLFEKFGTVVDVELSMHDSRRNRGLAFVTMGSPEEAEAARNSLELSEFEGRTLKMYYAKHRAKREQVSPPAPARPPITFNLFVANLPYEARAKDLKEFFATECATVDSARIVFHDNPRRPSGYGFVAFKSKKDADKALAIFPGKDFMGRAIRVARSKQFVKERTEEELAVTTDEDTNENVEVS